MIVVDRLGIMSMEAYILLSFVVYLNMIPDENHPLYRFGIVQYISTISSDAQTVSHLESTSIDEAVQTSVLPTPRIVEIDSEDIQQPLQHVIIITKHSHGIHRSLWEPKDVAGTARVHAKLTLALRRKEIRQLSSRIVPSPYKIAKQPSVNKVTQSLSHLIYHSHNMTRTRSLLRSTSF